MTAAPEPISRAVTLMASFPLPWGLCGGCAVDAWLGRITREHKDLDLAVFEEDQGALFEHLRGWRLIGHALPDDEHEDPWDGRPLGVQAHIHATADDGFELDVQVEERSADEWVLVREPRIAVPVGRMEERPAWGLPTVAPEVVLFYEAFDLRPRDETDIALLLAELAEGERSWLRDAVSLVRPGLPWPR
jgi:hypothetical protein